MLLNVTLQLQELQCFFAKRLLGISCDKRKDRRPWNLVAWNLLAAGLGGVFPSVSVKISVNESIRHPKRLSPFWIFVISSPTSTKNFRDLRVLNSEIYLGEITLGDLT